MMNFKLKKRLSRAGSTILCCLMMISALPVCAFAEGKTTNPTTVQTTEKDTKTKEENTDKDADTKNEGDKGSSTDKETADKDKKPEENPKKEETKPNKDTTADKSEPQTKPQDAPVIGYNGTTPIVDQKPNNNIKVEPSNDNALVLMDVGAQSPKGVPGDVVTVVLPIAVNREYLPSERYMLRNITIKPVIQASKKSFEWPFDVINASYVRHLDDMTYNSTAEVYYDFRISEFAKKGVYPVDFEVNATVWRYDDVNGTSVSEDVTFNLGVYITIVGDGEESGIITDAFGALQVAAANEGGGEYKAPTAKPGEKVELMIPVINKGGTLKNVTISPLISSNVEEFPFVAEKANYGQSFPKWESKKIEKIKYQFTVSKYATSGNKPVKFEATYYENGKSVKSEFVTYINVINGYKEPKEIPTTAMSVMVTGYKMFVNDAEVSGLTAGDDAVLRLTLMNNASWATTYKVVAGLSFANNNALTLTVGSSDAAYVSSIAAGQTADVDFKVSVKHDAQVGPSSLGIELKYETGDRVPGAATQNIMIPISQPMDIAIDEPIVYGTPSQDAPVSMSLNMTNMGRSKALNVVVLAKDGIAMTENYYGGDLLPGASLSADFQVDCMKTGSFDGNLIVQYEDDNGEIYSQEVPVALSVDEPVVEPAQTEPEEVQKTGAPVWLITSIIIAAVLAIVLVVAIIAKRKGWKMDKLFKHSKEE